MQVNAIIRKVCIAALLLMEFIACEESKDADVSATLSPSEAQAATKEKREPYEPVMEPSVAGSFYPASVPELKAEIEKSFIGAQNVSMPNAWAFIVPHAGYRFSGPVASTVYRQLKGRPIKRVVIVAFAHNPFRPNGMLKVQGMGTTRASAYRTPLGDMAIDVDEVDWLIKNSTMIKPSRDLFQGEHSLEIQLPFLQTVLPEAKLVPLLFGNQTDPSIAEALSRILAERYLKSDNTLVIASTDMSHFYSYSQAAIMDSSALNFVTRLDVDGLLRAMSERKVEFCGIMPVLSVMYAQRLVSGDSPVVLDYRNSGDTFGGRERVVGYSAVGFPRPEIITDVKSTKKDKESTMFENLTPDQKIRLLTLARKTVESWVRNKTKADMTTDDPLLKENGAAFVTLKISGELRGCIGHTEAYEPLWDCIRDMAIAASTQDPRFPPVSEAELPRLSYEITVLTPMKKIAGVDEIIVGKHGLMMEKGMRRGLLLPQVPVEWGWNREEFLNHTAQKAGLPASAWRDGSVTIYSFTGIVFGMDERGKQESEP